MAFPIEWIRPKIIRVHVATAIGRQGTGKIMGKLRHKSWPSGKALTGLIVIALVLAFSFLTAVSDAHAQTGKDPYKPIEKRDRDGDGKISPDEWHKSFKVFNKIDKDGDGFLTAEDFAKHWEVPLPDRGQSTEASGANSSDEGGDPIDRAKALLKESRVAHKDNRSEDALALIRKAAELIDGKISNPKILQKIYSSLGKREYGAGNALKAIDAMVKAVEIRSWPPTLATLVQYNLSVGRVKKAEYFAGQARASADRFYMKSGLPLDKRMLMERDIAMMDANLLQKQGLWAKAEQKIREALEVGEKLIEWDEKWRLFYLKIKWSLVKNLLKQDRAVEAEIVARDGLNEVRAKLPQGSTHEANLARFLGEALLAQGRIEEAEEMAAEALQLMEKSGEIPSSRKVVLAKRFVGMVLALQEDWSGADEQFVQISEVLADKQALKRGMIDNNPFVLLTAIKEGRGVDVHADLERKFSNLQKRLGDKNIETAQTRALLAMARAQMGEKDEALQTLKKTVPILINGSPVADADEDPSKSYTSIIQREILESYMSLLADRYIEKKTDNEFDPVAASFEIADQARGSTVQKALAASGARALVKTEELSQLVRVEQDNRKSIAAFSALLGEALGRPSSQQDADAIQNLRSNIERLRNERASAIDDIKSRFPEYASLMDPKPATLEDARSVLGAGDALISTYFAKDRGYVWAINANGDTAFAPIAMSTEEIGDSIAELRFALDPGSSGQAGIPEFKVETAYQLYEQLFKPLESVWKPAKNLIYVAHGLLGALPISVLPTSPITQPEEGAVPFASYRDVPWLAKTHSVSLIPSVAALTALRRLPRAPAGRSPFVGFGDPYFSKAQQMSANEMSLLDIKSPGGITMRGVPVVLRSAYRGTELEGGEIEKLPRLPDTAAEVNSIANVLKGGASKTVYLGVEASEKNVMSMDLSNYRVLIFATHGLIPGDLLGLTQPALAMTAPAVTGDEGDGLLTMEEILNIKLNADWVILSACNTASGGGAGAEAVSGLGQAFFYAGTRSLLASNWPVETVSAKALTTEIFSIQARDGSRSRAEALRLSMMKLMNSGEAKDIKTGKVQYAFAHPIFWAPFSLIGDGR